MAGRVAAQVVGGAAADGAGRDAVPGLGEQGAGVLDCFADGAGVGADEAGEGGGGDAQVQVQAGGQDAAGEVERAGLGAAGAAAALAAAAGAELLLAQGRG
ncbi:MAG: hypothetical protein WAL72_09520, partial [Streptosporangiaceae bacterium]